MNNNGYQRGYKKDYSQRFVFFRFCKKCGEKFRPVRKTQKVCVDCKIKYKLYANGLPTLYYTQNISPTNQQLSISHIDHKKPIEVALAGHSISIQGSGV